VSDFHPVDRKRARQAQRDRVCAMARAACVIAPIAIAVTVQQYIPSQYSDAAIGFFVLGQIALVAFAPTWIAFKAVPFRSELEGATRSRPVQK
jgi:hypothetical protein